MSHDIEQRLRFTAPPPAPPELRRPTLAAARAELLRATASTWVDAVYTSHRLRWAWAALCVLLLIGQLVVGGAGTPGTTGGDSTPAPRDGMLADALAIVSDTHAETGGGHAPRFDRDSLRQRLAADPLTGNLPL